jgi:hypothetical protein
MPIATVLLTDTFDQWRQKTNLLIGQINSLATSGTVLEISNPTATQMLVYDGSFFRNVSITGDITIDQNGHVAVVSGVNSITKGRMAFAGSMRNVY